MLHATRRLAALTVCMAVALACGMTARAEAQAREYGVESVPNVRLADARQYVSDPDGIISAAAKDSINAMLAALEKQTGIETAVVMLPSIGGDDVFDFSQRLFRTWGLGKKNKDNGLLFLFVLDQRKIRIHTGYGLEGVMTDAMSKRIQTTAMLPSFKQGDYSRGMTEGVRMAVRVLDGSMEADKEDGDDDISLAAVLAVLLMVVGMVVFVATLGNRQKCPKCHTKGSLKMMGSAVYKDRRGRRIRRTRYICQNCGYTMTKDEPYDDSGDAAALTGLVIGSMLGRGGAGGGSFGGFSGGSFGGGSSGGGGSTSGW